MDLKVKKLKVPEGYNIIFGHSHFIKTVEDLYEVMVTAVPNPQFGLAFCEASQERLVRTAGTDSELITIAQQNALEVGAGHSFMIIMKDMFPVNVLNAVKACQEVCTIFCATANPVEVVLAETGQGRAVLGVVDGLSPLGVEGEKEVAHRQEFLRQIGYKMGS